MLMSDGPIHIALGAFGPAYYRWEIQEMIPITYPDQEEVTMEPNVGQVENELIPEDALLEDSIWGLYGRRIDDNTAEHISDFTRAVDAVELARNLAWRYLRGRSAPATAGASTSRTTSPPRRGRPGRTGRLPTSDPWGLISPT